MTNLPPQLEGGPIAPLEREQRLYERVAEKILDLISTRTWKPGYHLPPERELSESFGVSRTVIREAIKALEARGVLESTIGSGVLVSVADFNMVSRSLQTYMQLSDQADFEIRLNEVRRVLEVELVALAAVRAAPGQIAQLREICAQMRAGDKTPQEMAALDFQLHTMLADATQNDLFKVLLAPLIDQLREQITLTWQDFLRPVDLVLSQHEAIVSAVEKHDPEAARQTMLTHLVFSREVLEELSQRKDEKP